MLEDHKSRTGARAPLTAAILAGGKSSRMGTDKALLPIGGVPLVQWMVRLLGPVFDQVMVLADSAEKYSWLQSPVYADSIPNRGSLGGVLTAVERAETEWVFIMAVDMPLARRGVLRIMADSPLESPESDVIVPRNGRHIEPLFACYRKTCAEPIRRVVEAGGLRIREFFDGVRVRELPVERFRAEDPELVSLLNLNTLEDYERALSHLGLDGLL